MSRIIIQIMLLALYCLLLSVCQANYQSSEGENMMQSKLAKGPFSGVTLNNITDTPVLVHNTVFKASAEQIANLGQGMEVIEQAGERVILTKEGFFIEFDVEVEAGIYSFASEASAPDSGTDSYWIILDNEESRKQLTPPVGNMGERSVAVNIDKTGKHKIRMILREAPGSVIKQISLYQPSVSISLPPMRGELKEIHPRMFFTNSDLDTMRTRLKNPRVRKFYTPAGILKRKPPAFKPGSRNGGSFRRLGHYAMSYLLEPDERKLKPLLDWLEMATTYPHCGVDLDAEYFMEGVALAYDFLYDYMPDDLRSRVRNTIVRQCHEIYQASLHGRTGGGLSFQQNHYWFAHLALALGAAAVYGEVPEAEIWLAWAWDRLERITLSFGPDGGFHEGPSYWDFSMPTLYMYIHLYERCTGISIPGADSGLRGQAEFRFRHLYPGFDLTAALEDTGKTKGRFSVSMILWEAKRFKDPIVMGIAELLNNKPNQSCWNLLWLDEKLDSQNPLDILPLGKYYPDIETVFARTSWDPDATAVAFVSRPMGGHKWAELCDKFGLGGTGHNHPEQNHFVLFGRGEVLAADPGYTYDKQTRNHNTVLIDGQGQYGDSEMWPRPNPGRSRITRFHSEGDITIIAGDATSAYPDKLGSKSFERTLVLAGPDLVVVRDHLKADEPKEFSWLLHHYAKLASSDDRWNIRKNNAQLSVNVLLPQRFTAEDSSYRPQYIHPTRDLTPPDPDIGLLELKTESVKEATFLIALIVSDTNQESPLIQNISTSKCDAVRVGEIVVAFNRGEGSMSVFMPWEENHITEAKVLVARMVDSKRQITESKE